MFTPFLCIEIQRASGALKKGMLYKLWVAVTQENVFCIEQVTDNKSESCAILKLNLWLKRYNSEIKK